VAGAQVPGIIGHYVDPWRLNRPGGACGRQHACGVTGPRPWAQL